MAGPNPAPVRQPDAARARILETARRCFASMGFEGTSTRQIATEAGVAQSLLLYHHRSKEALWRAVMDAIFQTVRTRMAAALEPVRDQPVTARLMAMASEFVTLCAEETDIHRIMILEGGHESERLTWLADTHLRGIFQQVTALIAEGQAEGVIRPGDPVLLYYGCIALAGVTVGQGPLIRRVSGSGRPLDPVAIVALIQAFLIIPAGTAG